MKTICKYNDSMKPCVCNQPTAGHPVITPNFEYWTPYLAVILIICHIFVFLRRHKRERPIQTPLAALPCDQPNPGFGTVARRPDGVRRHPMTLRLIFLHLNTFCIDCCARWRCLAHTKSRDCCAWDKRVQGWNKGIRPLMPPCPRL
jgi:hypothetical protein